MKTMTSAYKDLLYLVRMAVRQEVLLPNWTITTPLADLFKLASFHSIEALLYDSVKQLSASDDDALILKKWQVAHDKAYRKYLLFEAERQSLLAQFEQANIWTMLLKGTVLQHDYPKPYLRQMSDNDMMFDSHKRHEVKDIMIANGYDVGHFNFQYDDVYYKEPVYNFEMHVKASVAPEFKQYFANLEERLVTVSPYIKEMSPKDFYMYLLSHELKHYQMGGTGLRSFIDLHYYLRGHAQEVDFESINTDLKGIGLLEFELERRTIVSQLFGEDISAFSEILDNPTVAYYCHSGTYGVMTHSVDNKWANESSASRNFFLFYWRKLIAIDDLVANRPILQKHKGLIPFYATTRVVMGLFNPRNWQELSYICRKMMRK